LTKREAYLRALRNEQVDDLVWAPNFDYWLYISSAEGTLPEKYVGMSRNDIVRSIGGTIWNRSGGFQQVVDDSVKHSFSEQDGIRVDELHTPSGALDRSRSRQRVRTAQGFCQSIL
jgi:hypothetical protein